MTTLEDVVRIAAADADADQETKVCGVCGETRPGHLVMLSMHPIGQHYDLAPLEVTRNVWHCRDNAECLIRGDHPAEWTADLGLDWGDDFDARWEVSDV